MQLLNTKRVKTVSVILKSQYRVCSIITSLFALLCLSASASAAPVIWTGIQNTGSINLVAEGVEHVFYNDSSSSGQANASTDILENDAHGNAWHFDLYAAVRGYHVAYAAWGRIIFNDVVFTDISDPGRIGNIDVSANFQTTGDHSIVVELGLISYLPSPPPTTPQSNMYSADTAAVGSFSTATISVPLNEPLSFSMNVQYRPYSGYYGFIGMSWQISNAIVAFADLPFNLPAGITVNSIDAGIVDNAFGSVSSVADTPVLAARFHANSPNPFNPTTLIAFELEQAGPITLTVFDMAGHKVRTLLQADYQVGHHAVEWNGQNDSGQAVGSGVYLSQLRSGSFVTTRKMTLAK